jgi:hypothetical protein
MPCISRSRMSWSCARVRQRARRRRALVLPVVLIDDGRGKSDQRKNGACDQYGEPQTERQTAAH